MSEVFEIDGKKYIPAREVADFFGYSRDHITRLAKSKKIQATQLGRRWYVSDTSLQNYISDQKIEVEVRSECVRRERRAELRLRTSLAQSNARRTQLAKKSSYVAPVFAGVFFALLLAGSSYIVPAESVSMSAVAVQTHVLADDQDTQNESKLTVTHPVFTDDKNIALVAGSDRYVLKPTITSDWVQITP
jgi:excisionase family DNA binding protein